MKKLLSLLLTLCLSLSLAACGATNQDLGLDADPDQQADRSQDPNEEDEKKSDEESNKENLKDIHVSQTVDTMTSMSTVTIENHGNLRFSASVHVTFKDSANKIIGSDTIFVEDLSAGQFTYAKISLDSTDVQGFEYEFGRDTEFVEIESTKANSKDEVLSKQLAEEFEEGFGGAGTPELATSWYKFVEDISVYTSDNGGCAVITVNTDQQDTIDRIGNTVFGNYVSGNKGEAFSIDSVKVVNNSGDELFLRAN